MTKRQGSSLEMMFHGTENIHRCLWVYMNTIVWLWEKRQLFQRHELAYFTPVRVVQHFPYLCERLLPPRLFEESFEMALQEFEVLIRSYPA